MRYFLKITLLALLIVFSCVCFFNNTDCNAKAFKYKKIGRPILTHPSPDLESKVYYCTGKTQYFEVVFKKEYKTKFKYKLYRKKAGSKKYKKIKCKIVKRGGTPYDYYGDIIADKSSKAGTTYYYKIKAYKKIKGKTIYSKKSKAYKRVAIRDEGKFYVETVTPKSYTDQIILKMKSKKDNAPIKISVNSDSYVNYCNNSKSICYDGQIKEYSYDNKNWINTGACWLHPGQKVYLKIDFNGEKVRYTGYDKKSEFEIEEFWYYNHETNYQDSDAEMRWFYIYMNSKEAIVHLDNWAPY